MGNIMLGLKKFLQNKNIVTILGVIISIVILYFAYMIRVRNAINPETVPYAKELIPNATQIKESMIGTCKVPPSMLNGDVIKTVGEVADKYTALDAVIPKGSLFYKRAVVERDSLPDDIILDYPKGYQLYYQRVNMFQTQGNQILPGSYVDIIINAVDPKTNNVASGCLVSNVEVLAVRDASGLPVFKNIEDKLTPAMLIFALPEDYFKLLLVASQLKNTSYKVEISVKPNYEGLKEEPGDLELTSENLKKWIESFAIYD